MSGAACEIRPIFPRTPRPSLPEPSTSEYPSHHRIRPGSLPVIPLVLLCLCLEVACSPKPNESRRSSQNSIVQKVEKSGVELIVEISPKQPRLSDLVELTITITHPKSVEIDPPVFGQSVGDFTVRDYSQRTLSITEGGSASRSDPSTTEKETVEKWIIRYQLEPMFSGSHLVHSIPIAFASKSEDPAASNHDSVRDVLQTDPIEVDVTSELGDQTPDLAQVAPMAEPLDLQGSGVYWLWIVGSIMLAVGCAVVWILRSRRKQVEKSPQFTPEELAQSALEQLIAEQLPSKGLVKEFYLRLTGIVRVYIEGKTGLKAPEQTTEEFLRDMRNTHYFDAAQSNRLQEFLVAADLVKYAGQQPDEQSIQQSLVRAQEFISMKLPSQQNAGTSEMKSVDSEVLTGN